MISLRGPGWGSAWPRNVKSRALAAPTILQCLGYEQHRDYEIKRYGDEGASLKLTYPPVEKGAKQVKHYHPDYTPTIRKKAFWSR
jgi:hypothetical protein